MIRFTSKQQYTISRVTSFLLGLMGSARTRSRVDLLGLLDDEPILHQLADILAYKIKETKDQQYVA
jgi:hypothetical protein